MINYLQRDIGFLELVMLEYFSDIVAGALYASLTQLTFGIRFDKPIMEGVLPAGLMHLTLGWLINPL